MNIEIIRSVEEADKATGLAVVIDVFRAFSVEAYIFANGASKIIPVLNLEEAYLLKRENPDYILIGEREGVKPEGFDFGNSPTEILDINFSGKTIVHTTSNGTKGLMNTTNADTVLTGSFLIVNSIIKYIKQNNFQNVYLISTAPVPEEDSEDIILAFYIRDILKSNNIKLNSCTICGILRRYLMNKSARKLKFTKIATGHNLNDESQTILMNQFKGNIKLSAKLGPTTGIFKDKKFIPRIKPLYFCKEEDIRNYSKLKNFPVNYEPCPCSVMAYRKSVRVLLNKYELNNENIVKSFLKIQPELKNFYKNEKINYCTNCGEPTTKGECKTCQIIKKLRP